MAVHLVSWLFSKLGESLAAYIVLATIDLLVGERAVSAAKLSPILLNNQLTKCTDIQSAFLTLILTANTTTIKTIHISTTLSVQQSATEPTDKVC